MALSTSRFWSSFRFELPEFTIPFPVIVMWLERSADAPLEITLLEAHPTSDHYYLTEVFDILALHIHRWRYLDVSMISPSLTVLFQSLPLSTADLLEDLRLVVGVGGLDDYERVLLNVKRIPNLRSFKYCTGSPPLPFSLTTHPPPWLNKLASIHIKCNLTTGDILELMRHCTSATRIAIEMERSRSSRVSTPTSIDGASIALNNLCILDITLDEDTYPALRCLNLPSLRILRFTKGWTSRPINTSLLLDFISNSASSTEILRIRGDGLSFSHLATFLLHPRVSRIPIVTASIVNYQDFILHSMMNTSGHMDSFKFAWDLGLAPMHGTIGWANLPIHAKCLHDFPSEEIVASVPRDLF